MSGEKHAEYHTEVSVCSIKEMMGLVVEIFSHLVTRGDREAHLMANIPHSILVLPF
jgi:hypothetical protein